MTIQPRLNATYTVILLPEEDEINYPSQEGMNRFTCNLSLTTSTGDGLFTMSSKDGIYPYIEYRVNNIKQVPDYRIK